jgi:hypothetical protein
MKNLNERKKTEQMLWAVVLLIIDLLYLALVTNASFSGIDLRTDKNMQYIIHITVILSTLVYLFFVEMIFRTEKDSKSGRLALIFASLFIIPVIIGRAIGIFCISQLGTVSSIFNFYENISVSRTIELISWTILFPLSVLFLAIVFYKKGGKIGVALCGLCLLSAVCCFIAFMMLISSSPIYFWIGLLGWGGLFLLIIILYMFDLVIKPNMKVN